MADDDKTDKALDSCGEAVLLLLAMPLLIGLRAWIAAQVWAWHLTGLLGPVPSLVVLVGLMCLVGAIRPYQVTSRDTDHGAVVQIATHTLTALLTLLVAWVCTFIGYQG